MNDVHSLDKKRHLYDTSEEMLQPSWNENHELPLQNLQEYGEHFTNQNAKGKKKTSKMYLYIRLNK